MLTYEDKVQIKSCMNVRYLFARKLQKNFLTNWKTQQMNMETRTFEQLYPKATSNPFDRTRCRKRLAFSSIMKFADIVKEKQTFYVAFVEYSFLFLKVQKIKIDQETRVIVEKKWNVFLAHSSVCTYLRKALVSCAINKISACCKSPARACYNVVAFI